MYLWTSCKLASPGGRLARAVRSALRFERMSTNRDAQTFRLGLGGAFDASWFIKVASRGGRDAVSAEAAMFTWLKGRLPVPKSRYFSCPVGAVLVTSGIGDVPGHLIGQHSGGQALVETLAGVIMQVQELPRDGVWGRSTPPSAAPAHDHARRRLHPDHRRLDDGTLQERLIMPCDSASVVSHGDLFLTNLVFSADGDLAAVLDVGQMQPACPNMDVAILSWSLEMLIGHEEAEQLLKMFGLDSTHPEVLYHRLSYDYSLLSPEPWRWLDVYFPGYTSDAT